MSVGLASECTVPYNCKETISGCVVKKKVFKTHDEFVTWINANPDIESMVITAYSSVTIVYKDACVKTMECKDLSGYCNI